jgi:hypothetical protein
VERELLFLTLRVTRTMAGFTKEQRQMLLDKLPDTANLALVAARKGGDRD